MKKQSSFLCELLIGACTGRVEKSAGINYDYMDTSVRPGDDFARYATGRWSALNPQPPEYPMWGTVTIVSDDNLKALDCLFRDIAAADNKKGSIEQKIGDLYNMVMDSTRLNREGAAPLKAHISEIDAISSREELLRRCALEHENLLFSLFVSADEKDSDNNIVCVSQSGLSLGNRDYYLSDDPPHVLVREAMKEYITNLFILLGSQLREEVQQVCRQERMADVFADRQRLLQSDDQRNLFLGRIPAAASLQCEFGRGRELRSYRNGLRT